MVWALHYYLNFLNSFKKDLNSIEAMKLTNVPTNAIIIVTIRLSGGILGKMENTVPPIILILSSKLNCILTGSL
jgi:hypothetical protein